MPELGYQLYQGFGGGLYPNYGNNRPPSHLAAGIDIAVNQIRPLDRSGQVNTNSGKIVLLSIGMSNATQEWATKGTNTFQNLANHDLAKNPQLMVIDGALGGQDAATWTNLYSTNWTITAISRLTNAGLSTQQVQIIWMKDALRQPSNDGAFPAHAQLLQTDFEMMARNAKFWFPNLKIIYMASRTRAYVADASLNPEPYAYESGFSVKWMIEKQINGDSSLNFDPLKGPVVAPWLSWGPYIWTDGMVTRSDHFIWVCPDDLENDYTHPSPTGVGKVASQLLAFFKTDPTATPWFLKKSSPPFTLSVFAAPTNGIAPLNINLLAAATPNTNIAQFVWTFDDGEFFFGQSLSKTFRTPGVYTARVTATDKSGNNLTGSIIITVNSTFQFWKSQKFTSDELADPTISGPAADPDGDALPNLLEYAMGLEPKTANPGLPNFSTQDGFFTSTFTRLKAATDVTLVLEGSADLANWNSNFTEPSQIIDNGPIETVTVQDKLSANAGRFYRLKATK